MARLRLASNSILCPATAGRMAKADISQPHNVEHRQPPFRHPMTTPMTTRDSGLLSIRSICRPRLVLATALTVLLLGVLPAFAQRPAEHRPGGEVNIQLPNLDNPDVLFMGMTGHRILMSGLVVCVLGLLFGAWTYNGVKNLPVHKSMADISALIYETCKAYLVQQGKFLLILEIFIGVVMVA